MLKKSFSSFPKIKLIFVLQSISLEIALLLVFAEVDELNENKLMNEMFLWKLSCLSISHNNHMISRLTCDEQNE